MREIVVAIFGGNCYGKSSNGDSGPSVTDREETGDCMTRVGETGNGQIGSRCDRRLCKGG